MKKIPLVCVDLGNRRTQMGDGNPAGEVKDWKSLVKFSRTFVRSFGSRPGSAQIEYQGNFTLIGQGVEGMDGTVPVHKLDAQAGQGKITTALSFVLGMLDYPAGESELEIDELALLHPDPTEEVEQQFRSILEGEHEFSRNGCPLKAKINFVNVMPEGVPAYYYAMFNKYVSPSTTNAIIDFGGLTNVMRLFKKSGPIEDAQVVLRQAGTAMLARYISKDAAVTQHFRVDRPDIELIMDGLDKLGGYRYGGDGFSFADCVAFHQEEWLKFILGEYTASFAKWLNQIDRTVLVGGSAYYALPTAKAMDDFFLVPNFSEANIRGMGLARDLTWMNGLSGELISHEEHLKIHQIANANRSKVAA